jgi:signal transduction histidine kinase
MVMRGLGRRWVSAVYTPTHDSSGNVDGWVAVVLDITERRQLENALKDSDRRKDEFLATLAHELRNPLAPIKSSVAILKTLGSSNADLIASRDVIERQVHHMARLLDDLLDVNRITTGKLELRREPTSLADLVETAVETSRPIIDARSHELTVSLPDEPILLHADPVRMAQVFSNLLNNAAKYTDRGGRIWLTAERQGSDVLIWVKDNGIGITAEMLRRVFDMFTQESPALERSDGGLGIGLSLVKGLVELQGGSITAKSEGPGRGSEFLVRLPILASPAAPQPPALPADRQTTSPVKLRLLIADDLQDSADSLAMLMRTMGHEVETAYDGEQAVLMAEDLKPDAVLLDIGMPKLNGYDACRRIRQRPWAKDKLLIALTGWGQETDRRRTQEAGFDYHIVKPIDIDNLQKLLASI